MHLVRAGRRIYNLCYLIVAEEMDEPPGRLRVTFESGKEFDLDDDEADQMRRGLEAAIEAGGSSSKRGARGSGSVGRVVSVPPPVSRKKRRG